MIEDNSGNTIGRDNLGPAVIADIVSCGPISKNVHSISMYYMCTNFGAFITKCTIVCYAAPLDSASWTIFILIFMS